MNKRNLEQFTNSDLTEVKLETNKLSEMLADTKFHEISSRMHQSGASIKTKWKCGKSILIDTNKSGIRYEPYSNYCERRKIYAKFMNNSQLIINEYPKHTWHFVTLTTKNCHVSNLRNAINTLNSSFQRLIRGDKFSRYFKQNQIEYGNAGYFKSIEISMCENDDMMCRPHIHILFHLPPSFYYPVNYISLKKLEELWKTALSCNIPSDYEPSVDKKKIDHEISDIACVGSYIVKHEINLSKNKEFTVLYIENIRRARLISKAGTLRDITKDNKSSKDIKTKDDINIEDDIKTFKYDVLSSKYLRGSKGF